MTCITQIRVFYTTEKAKIKLCTHPLPFGPFTPIGPGGPLSPGRPLAPECPGKPLSPGIPGGPGGPGFPGKPATPDSGLLKLAASWASCSVGEQQTGDTEADKPLGNQNWNKDIVWFQAVVVVRYQGKLSDIRL